jgi:hypothetical protein
MRVTSAALLLLLAATHALAGILDADDFAPGTDVSNAVPGMTVSWMWFEAGEIELEPLVVWPTADECGDGVMPVPRPQFLCDHRTLGSVDERATGNFDQVWVWFEEGEAEFSAPGIHVVLDVPSTSFYARTWDAADGIRALFFDEDGNFIEMLSPLQFDPDPVIGQAISGTMHPSAPFTSVMIGGWSAASIFNSIGVPAPVPTPGFLTLMAGGLAALAVARRKVARAGRRERRTRRHLPAAFIGPPGAR